MTALSGLMTFLMTIIIILHLNIKLCFGSSTRSKYFLVEGNARNASLSNHADDGHLSLRGTATMGDGLHSPRQRKIKKSETGLDYQESTTSMYNEASPPAADRSMSATVYYCRRAVNKPSQFHGAWS